MYRVTLTLAPVAAARTAEEMGHGKRHKPAAAAVVEDRLDLVPEWRWWGM